MGVSECSPAAMHALVWLLAAAPFECYWLAALYYDLASGTRDVAKTGTRSRPQPGRERVARTVALLLATGVPALAFAYYALFAPRGWAVRPLRLLLGLAWIDTAEYWLHRLFHAPLLYARFHKVHHELRAPFSYGGLYNHHAEGTATSAAVILGLYACGLSYVELVVATTLAFVATVRQHTLAPRGGERAHHWRHHSSGGKGNYAQPFTDWWDRAMGTKMKE